MGFTAQIKYPGIYETLYFPVRGILSRRHLEQQTNAVLSGTSGSVTDNTYFKCEHSVQEK